MIKYQQSKVKEKPTTTATKIIQQTFEHSETTHFLALKYVTSHNIHSTQKREEGFRKGCGSAASDQMLLATHSAYIHTNIFSNTVSIVVISDESFSARLKQK